MQVIKKEIIQNTINEKVSDSIIHDVSELFNLSKQNRIKLANNKIARLVMALPYLADCPDPHRIAVSHMIYLLSETHKNIKPYFLHNFSDNADVFQRLERISNYPGGDKRIVKRGLNLLAIIMIRDYARDMDYDRKIRKYNPLHDNTWDHKKILAELEKEIKSVPCSQMDAIMTANEAYYVWWELP
jgi:hypothetical protein